MARRSAGLALVDAPELGVDDVLLRRPVLELAAVTGGSLALGGTGQRLADTRELLLRSPDAVGVLAGQCIACSAQRRLDRAPFAVGQLGPCSDSARWVEYTRGSVVLRTSIS
jgi:hypothetical protein